MSAETTVDTSADGRDLQRGMQMQREAYRAMLAEMIATRRARAAELKMKVAAVESEIAHFERLLARKES